MYYLWMKGGICIMELVGLNWSVNGSGNKVYTLHVAEMYGAYFSDAANGRGCVGMRTEEVYAGNVDCSHLKPGMQIDILYDRAVTTSKGTFQVVKRVEVIE